MANNSYACRIIGWLHRQCAGERATVEVPLKLREAVHGFNNEVTALKGHVFKLKQSSDELMEIMSNGDKK